MPATTLAFVILFENSGSTGFGSSATSYGIFIVYIWWLSSICSSVLFVYATSDGITYRDKANNSRGIMYITWVLLVVTDNNNNYIF